MRGSVVLQGGGGLLLLVGAGSLAALICGSALSLELGSWRRLPEVAAAGGWRCAVIATSVLVCVCGGIQRSRVVKQCIFIPDENMLLALFVYIRPCYEYDLHTVQVFVLMHAYVCVS